VLNCFANNFPTPDPKIVNPLPTILPCPAKQFSQ
jgi:hypothetical protein